MLAQSECMNLFWLSLEFNFRYITAYFDSPRQHEQQCWSGPSTRCVSAPTHTHTHLGWMYITAFSCSFFLTICLSIDLCLNKLTDCQFTHMSVHVHNWRLVLPLPFLVWGVHSGLQEAVTNPNSYIYSGFMIEYPIALIGVTLCFLCQANKSNIGSI